MGLFGEVVRLPLKDAWTQVGGMAVLPAHENSGRQQVAGSSTWVPGTHLGDLAAGLLASAWSASALEAFGE